MSRIYNQKDIETWACFSGDHNIVHFDHASARKNGLNGIIVQGMLSLQHSKILIADKIKAPGRIAYNLKRPVYKDSNVIYSIIEKDEKIALKTKNEKGECTISGMAYSLAGQPVIKRAKNEIIIKPDFIFMQMDMFKRKYPDVNIPWVMMDAFLFSVCFKYQNGDPFYKKSLKIEKEPDKSKVVTLQVDQDIIINKDDFSLTDEYIKDLRFFYEEQDIIKEDYSVYSILNYQVYHKESLLFQSSMGSITRAYEAISNRLNKRNDDVTG